MNANEPVDTQPSTMDEEPAKIPARKLAVVTCMDARVDPWRIVGAGPGEVHTIRNAGGVITPDVIRSLVASTRLLGVTRVQLIMHSDCGLEGLDDSSVYGDADRAPIPLRGFASVGEELRRGVERLRDEPLLDLPDGIGGFVFDVETGELHPLDA